MGGRETKRVKTRLYSLSYFITLCLLKLWPPLTPSLICICPHFQKWRPHMWVAAAKSLQSCLTLCDPIGRSPPGSPNPGILQARTLEWVAISFSNAWKWKVKVKSLSHARLLATPWTAAYQATSSWDFPGKSTGVGCHCLLRNILQTQSIVLWCYRNQKTRGTDFKILSRKRHNLTMLNCVVFPS